MKTDDFSKIMAVPSKFVPFIRSLSDAEREFILEQ